MYEDCRETVNKKTNPNSDILGNVEILSYLTVKCKALKIKYIQVSDMRQTAGETRNNDASLRSVIKL